MRPPVHYWPLDELSGAVVADTLGDLGNGAVNGDAGDATSIAVDATWNRARDLELGDPAWLDLWTGAEDLTYSLTEWSIGLRFNREAGFEYPHYFAQRTGLASSVIEIEGAEGTQIVVTLTNGAGTTVTIDASGLADHWDGLWHRLFVTGDGTTVRLYLDGTLLGSASSTVALLPKSDIRIGYSDAWLNDSRVKVDDIGLFDFAMTQPQVAEASPAPLGDIVEFVDWAADLDPLTTRTYYALDIDDGVLDVLRIPMSSWQATLQSDRSSFVQAVVPNIAAWITAIEARTTPNFIISVGVLFDDGTTQEEEIARAPMSFRYDEGPTNSTGTITGYRTVDIPATPRTRTLRDVRSFSTTGSNYRARCSIDFFLRPGDTAVVRDVEMLVAWINYYANASDQYMDVGTRAL